MKTGIHYSLPLLQVLHHDFVQGLTQEKNFITTSSKLLNENTPRETLRLFADFSKIEDLKNYT
jgi:hypothetical protein